MSNTIEPMPAGVVLLKYPQAGLSPIPYLLVDQESGIAAMIDPQHDSDRYLEDAWRMGARIRHVFLTQLYPVPTADLLQLRERSGATIYVGAWGRPDFEFMPLKQGDALEFGRVRLRIVETPGHRLEAIVILLYERRAGDSRPVAAFTGETVLPGDIGRPEPLPDDGFGTADLAAMLHASLHERILTLPDSTRLFPSRENDVGMFGRERLTIGAQRLFNPGFQSMPTDEFVRRVTLGMVAEPPPHEAGDLRLRPASVCEVLRGQRAGAQVVDVRDPDQFAVAHFAGSLNLPLMADTREWAGTVIDRDRPILLVAPPGQEGVAATRLLENRFTQVASFLEGGAVALMDHPALVRHRSRISFAALGGRILSGLPCFILDTRPAGRTPVGPSVLGYTAPLENLRQELAAIPRGPEIIVCDDTPYRSSAAASLLQSEGYENVADVAGGLALWGRIAP